ncbi:MAG: CRTAC1 family protein [Limisphaerales bacterium]
MTRGPALEAHPPMHPSRKTALPLLLRARVSWLLLGLALAGCDAKHPPKSGSPPSLTTPPPAADWLEDITDRLGVDFVHAVGPVGSYYMPESLGSGVAIFDFDSDGRMDLFLLQNAGPDSTARHQLYHQGDDGSFLNVSEGSGLNLPGRGMGVAVGDVNNDGRPDVLITEVDRARLFRNLGGGRFEERPGGAGIINPHWGSSVAFVDYDRDGWLDCVVVNYIDYSESNHCHDPQGRRTYCGPSGFPGVAPRLFRNLGPSAEDGTGFVRFEDTTVRAGLAQLAGPGLGVVCADATGDRWPDLLIANDGQMNWLLVNQRDGTFTEEAARRGVAFNEMGGTQANMGVALGDVDGDNLFDILITHLHTETHALWKQGPRGLFQDRTSQTRVAASRWRGTGFGAVFADLDNDGALDLAIANGAIKRQSIPPPPRGKANSDPFWNGFEQRSQILLNDGRGTFTDVSDQHLSFTGTAAVARGLAVGDLDNDGGPDLVVTRIAAPVRVFHNSAPRGHWLTIHARLPGHGDRDAYGATIRIDAGGFIRTAWVNPSHSYLCSHDPRVHFGLGSLTRVDSVNVVWPDGSEEEFGPFDANQILTLRQATGRPVQNPADGTSRP